MVRVSILPISISGRWSNPLGLLAIAAFAWVILPGLLPLVVFGLLIALLGEGLVAFTLSVAGGVGMSLLYPHLFGSASYNADGGAVSFTVFIMLPMDSVIFGLLVLNAFFVVMFQNRHFKKYALPMIRSKLRTSGSRLRWGWGLGLVNFCDDLSAGGIINRLYQNDIKSPGVSESYKRRMLVMVLLLANSFPALVPFSSWTAFYGKVDPQFNLGQFAYILLPLTLVFYCLCIALFSPSGWGQQEKQDRLPVIGVDFLRERNPPNPGMNDWLMLGIMAVPLVTALGLLIWQFLGGTENALLNSFAIGLLVQLLVVTGLGWWEHYCRRGASPVIESPGLESAREGAAAALQGLRDLRERLIRGPGQKDNPVLSENPSAAVAGLNRSIRLAADVQRSLARVPECLERLHPTLPLKTPLCQRLDHFWASQPDRLLADGVTEMVAALLKVYLMLILAEATKVCFGLAASGNGKSAVGAMLTDDAPYLRWGIECMESIGNEFGTIIDLKVLAAGFFVSALLLGLRHLRLSSAWGVLAMIYPLVAVILDGLGVSRSEGQLSLVHACFFGLIVSFGVWCNSTLKTGDNVSIAAEIQDRDPEELVEISWWTSFWPLVFSATGLILALAFHPVLERQPACFVWYVLPFFWAAFTAGLSYRLTRKRLVTG